MQLRRRLGQPLDGDRALNAASYLAHRGVACPVLFVCEDNGIGISTRSPRGWPRRRSSSCPGWRTGRPTAPTPRTLLRVVAESLADVRRTRRPGVLHLRTVRLMGHAGSDAEIAYRSRSEIEADYERDPLLGTRPRAGRGRHRVTARSVLERYEATAAAVMDEAARVLEREAARPAATRSMAPLAFRASPRPTAGASRPRRPDPR